MMPKAQGRRQAHRRETSIGLSRSETLLIGRLVYESSNFTGGNKLFFSTPLPFQVRDKRRAPRLYAFLKVFFFTLILKRFPREA